MELLRFITAGSVDDGKSTLIGRMLYDARCLPLDTLAYLEEKRNLLPDGSVNLALLTDGLRAEREQGITIDVAYKYFATPQRKFIIADAPGHVQYTRNMVTGASNADLVIILVDARHGIIEQTRRHSYLATLLGIRKLVVAVNKMDLQDWQQERFLKICRDYQDFLPSLGGQELEVVYIPLSALRGDNVVQPSSHTPWYSGPTLLSYLETVPTQVPEAACAPRFPVQLVIRPQSPEFPDWRGYAGKVASGIFNKGDKITVFPGGLSSQIVGIEGLQGSQSQAVAGESVTLLLAHNIDISRGDMLALPGQAPLITDHIRAQVCWMDPKGAKVGGRYLMRVGTRTVRALLEEIEAVLDISTLQEGPGGNNLSLNDIARVRLRLATEIPADEYRQNRRTGALILIDEGSNLTVAGGVLLASVESQPQWEV